MKAIIYLRTSTKDQNPELQKEECIKFCKEREIEVEEVVQEQGSAYKLEKIRPKWESVVKRAKTEKLSIVLWKYDRCFRNRKEFYKFMKVMFEVYGQKVFSVTEPSILSFWEMMDNSKSDNPIFDELLKGIFQAMWNFMIQQAGEEAEEESKKKSERVKLAVRKVKGITKSYKGNKWGRKRLSKQVLNKVLELNKKNLSIREIAKQVSYYDKNNNKRNLSPSAVHKLLKENLEDSRIKKIVERDVQ